MRKCDLSDVINEIKDMYNVSDEIFFTKPDRRMPSRNAIIAILKDLRNIMFPGYFTDGAQTSIDPTYFIGNTAASNGGGTGNHTTNADPAKNVLVDCVISNCIGSVAQIALGGTFVRCRIQDNMFVKPSAGNTFLCRYNGIIDYAKHKLIIHNKPIKNKA